MLGQNHIDLKDEVLEKIRTGQVKMKSKTVFTLKSLGLKGSFGLLIALAVLTFSLVIFFINQQSSSQALGLGGRGTAAFLNDLPFGWFIFIIVLVVLATFIYRRYSLAYRKSFRHSLTTLSVIVILVGSLFSLTGLHQALAAKAASVDWPFLKSIYRRALSCDFDSDYILIAKIVSFDRANRSAEVVTWGHIYFTLAWTEETKFISVPKPEDFFIAVGYQSGDVFYAQGVRRFPLKALKNRCFNEGKSLGEEIKKIKEKYQK